MNSQKVLTDFSHSYPYSVIFLNSGFLELNSFLETEYKNSTIFILLDENTKEMCYPVLVTHCPLLKYAKLIEISSGENFKTLETCKFVWDFLSYNNANRDTLVINLGGGVICDLGGFAASTFKRGVSFINIPTTLLAMVDASGGGKVGIDYFNLKNQVGLFNNPKGIFIDLNFLRSLPKSELLSGFSEVIKHALIIDYEYWKFIEKTPIALMKWKKIILKSIYIKSKIIYNDPLEKNERKKLNFGHTVGHALESYSFASNTQITFLHGEAVAMGMIIESYLSYKKVGLSHLQLDKITSFIVSFYKLVKIPEKAFSEIYNFILNDKKNKNNNINFTLLKNIGESVIDVSCSETEIKKGFEYYSSVI